jgi:hypothetical protein
MKSTSFGLARDYFDRWRSHCVTPIRLANDANAQLAQQVIVLQEDAAVHLRALEAVETANNELTAACRAALEQLDEFSRSRKATQAEEPTPPASPSWVSRHLASTVSPADQRLEMVKMAVKSQTSKAQRLLWVITNRQNRLGRVAPTCIRLGITLKQLIPELVDVRMAVARGFQGLQSDAAKLAAAFQSLMESHESKYDALTVELGDLRDRHLDWLQERDAQRRAAAAYVSLPDRHIHLERRARYDAQRATLAEMEADGFARRVMHADAISRTQTDRAATAESKLRDLDAQGRADEEHIADQQRALNRSHRRERALHSELGGAFAIAENASTVLSLTHIREEAISEILHEATDIVEHLVALDAALGEAIGSAAADGSSSEEELSTSNYRPVSTPTPLARSQRSTFGSLSASIAAYDQDLRSTGQHAATRRTQQRSHQPRVGDRVENKFRLALADHDAVFLRNRLHNLLQRYHALREADVIGRTPTSRLPLVADRSAASSLSRRRSSPARMRFLPDTTAYAESHNAFDTANGGHP